MTKTLPVSIALHLLLISAVIVASGRSVFHRGTFIPGAIIVNLDQAAPDTKPAIKQDALGNKETAPVITKKKPSAATVTKEKTEAAHAPFKINTEAATAQAQTKDNQVKSSQMMAAQMWRPFYMRASIGFWIHQKAVFLDAERAMLQSLIGQQMKKEETVTLAGTTAKVLLSYGPDGGLTGADVSSGSDALKALLEGINWQAAPLPAAYKLSLKGLALRIKVGKGITIGEEAL